MKWVLAFALALTPALARAESAPRTTETGLPERWASPAVTVVLDPSLEDLGPGATEAVEDAIGTWVASVPALPAVTLSIGAVRATVARDGQNVILAGPVTTPGHEGDVALTTTWASDATGDVLEADVVFNTKYAFAAMAAPPPACSRIFDVGAVATHESGHFFGLGEDWDDHATTMYVVTAPCDSRKRALTAPDTVAITALYASKDTVVAQCGTSPAHPASGAAVGASLALALALAFRRMRCDEANGRGAQARSLVGRRAGGRARR